MVLQNLSKNKYNKETFNKKTKIHLDGWRGEYMSEIIELVNEASSEGIQKEYEYKYILTEQIYKVLNNESFKELSIQSNQKIRFTAKSKKTRPYIYFDTPALDLLNKKAQFSVRKTRIRFWESFSNGKSRE